MRVSAPVQALWLNCHLVFIGCLLCLTVSSSVFKAYKASSFLRWLFHRQAQFLCCKMQLFGFSFPQRKISLTTF